MSGITEDERIAFHGRLYFMDMLNKWGVSPAQKQIIYNEWVKYKKAHPKMRMEEAGFIFGSALRDSLYRNLWDIRHANPRPTHPPTD